MNILLVTDSYPPEIRSASHLMQELAEELSHRKHKVSVVTSYPQYNLPDEIKGKTFREVSLEDNIRVLRIKTLPHHKVNLIMRGLSQLTMPYIFLYKINRYLGRDFKIIIIYSPPLPLAYVGKFLKKQYKTKVILNVQDIFPQNAIDLGALKYKFLIRFFEHMEKKSYESADVITVHSKSNKEFLIREKNVTEDKLHILHNWIDIAPYTNVGKGNYFRKKYGLGNKFIILFAGVIGPSQGLELIIKAANELRYIEDLCFLIVGDGTEKEKLVKMAEGYNLNNIVFKPFISKDEYTTLVREADVGLVCLTSLNKTPVVPGKILGYMAAAIPVLAFLNKESDGHELIKEAKCGYSDISDDYRKVVNLIGKISSERERLGGFGKNGFKYVTEHFEKGRCIDSLEELF